VIDTSGSRNYRTLPPVPKWLGLIAIKLQPLKITIVVFGGCNGFGENLSLWLPTGKVVHYLHCTTAFRHYELQRLTLSYGAVVGGSDRW
jgi:hypothetical protein